MRNGTQTFTATGTAPFFWTISNTALGSIGTTTGIFTAANTTGQVTVSVTDSTGNTGSAIVTITSPQTLTVTPNASSVTRNGTQAFTATGGTAPFFWSLSNPTLGSIGIGTGIFTAGIATGTSTVTVTDSAGNTGSATVTVVNSSIVVSPGNLSLSALPGRALAYVATGAAGTVVWSLSGATRGYAGATINAVTGVVTITAMPTSVGTAEGNQTLTITAADGIVQSGTATLTLTATSPAPIVVNPATRTLSSIPTAAPTYVATGAAGTVTWSLSGATNLYAGAAIDANTGVVTIATMPTALQGNQTLTITASDGFVPNGTATLTLNAP